MEHSTLFHTTMKSLPEELRATVECALRGVEGTVQKAVVQSLHIRENQSITQGSSIPPTDGQANTNTTSETVSSPAPRVQNNDIPQRQQIRNSREHHEECSVLQKRSYEWIFSKTSRVTAGYGQLRHRVWKVDGLPVFCNNTNKESGWGGMLAVLTSLWHERGKVTIEIRILRHQPRNQFSLHFGLSWQRVVDPNSDIVTYVKHGSLQAVRKIFSAGKATPRDITQDGNSLLHVCYIFVPSLKHLS
jgi:hypothetical protein